MNHESCHRNLDRQEPGHLLSQLTHSSHFLYSVHPPPSPLSPPPLPTPPAFIDPLQASSAWLCWGQAIRCGTCSSSFSETSRFEATGFPNSSLFFNQTPRSLPRQGGPTQYQVDALLNLAQYPSALEAELPSSHHRIRLCPYLVTHHPPFHPPCLLIDSFNFLDASSFGSRGRPWEE